MALKGEIRIIAGRWRGRKLPVLSSQGLRPTTDRSKETLFNWLAPYLDGSNCLDCFSGSGSLGFEAVSRGARQAILLEKERAAASQLMANQQKLAAEQMSIIQTDSLTWLAKPASMQFDLVFIDPPFGLGLVPQTIALLSEYGWLAPAAWIYIETEQHHAPLNLPISWQRHRQKQAGQVCSRLFQYQPSTDKE
ncbi:16S rRNA (guanine(966)-N(2))-methyltransferase RsmD [Utexia brackfieldae]|uniref:16S rRNA (guanine(966)-N(2))-methyltransferase RsmD n=1 Tax=Utexia brackfieldae TaxID=3074108 RepID=UPI00370CFE0F